MHMRIMLMVGWFFCSSSCRGGWAWIRQSHDMNTANVGSTRDISLQWTRRWPGGQRFASHIATEPWRPCNAAHPDDCACPMLWLHSSFIVKASDTRAHKHARVTVMISRLAAAHFVDGAESQIFPSHGWNTANVGSCAVSLHSLMWDVAGIGRHRRRIDGARWCRARGEVVWKHRLPERYRCHNAGPRFSLRPLASCSLGSRNRLVGFSQCRHNPLPRSRASAPAEHFLQRLPAGTSWDAYGRSRALLGEAMAPLAESMQWPRNQFGAPVLYTVTSYMATTTGYAWRAKPVQTYAPEEPTRRGRSGHPLFGGDSYGRLNACSLPMPIRL